MPASLKSPSPGGEGSQNELLTVDEVCDYLKISRSALYGLRRHGMAPPAIKIGRQLRFRRVDLDEWINAKPDSWLPGDTNHGGRG
jgi:excisionase family DNA binding protein